MKKTIEFECDNCWDFNMNRHLRFQTSDWISFTEIDYPAIGGNSITIQATCPKCNCLCYERYEIDELLEMVFDLQEEINSLKKGLKR